MKFMMSRETQEYSAMVTRVVPRTLTESLSMKDIFIL